MPPPEQAQRHGQVRGFGKARENGILEALKRGRPVGERRGERAGRHLFETDDQDALHGAAGDGLPGEVEGGGAGGRVVVDVDDRDCGESEGYSARCPVAVDVAGLGLLDVGVLHPGIRKSRASGGGREFVVGHGGLAGAAEGEHADAGDDGRDLQGQGAYATAG